jgi:hypothetical protein
MSEEQNKSDYRWWDEEKKLVKLEHAFAIGCNDKEACSFAEITVDQLYYYTRVVNKQFQLKKERLKDQPILKAKQTIVDGLDKEENAKWYLERRANGEFSTKQVTEHTGKVELVDNSELDKLAEELDSKNKQVYEKI